MLFRPFQLFRLFQLSRLMQIFRSPGIAYLSALPDPLIFQMVPSPPFLRIVRISRLLWFFRMCRIAHPL